jgi:cytoskeletal protein RodZ
MLSVGEVLKKTREKKGLTLEQVEKDIKIRKKFLEAIENDDWRSFSSKIYIDGLIKNYSNLLDLDVNKMMAFFRREYEKTEEVKFKKRISSQYLTPETKKVVISGVGLIILFFLGYFIYQLNLYFSPPRLDIIQPTTNTFKREERIKIIGKTEKEASILILGERVYQNKEGIFEYYFPLKIGDNQLQIEVVGANGKKSIIKKDYIRLP